MAYYNDEFVTNGHPGFLFAYSFTFKYFILNLHYTCLSCINMIQYIPSIYNNTVIKYKGQMLMLNINTQLFLLSVLLT